MESIFIIFIWILFYFWTLTIVLAFLVKVFPVSFIKVLLDMVGWLDSVLGWCVAMPIDAIKAFWTSVDVAHQMINYISFIEG